MPAERPTARRVAAVGGGSLALLASLGTNAVQVYDARTKADERHRERVEQAAREDRWQGEYARCVATYVQQVLTCLPDGTPRTAYDAWQQNFGFPATLDEGAK